MIDSRPAVAVAAGTGTAVVLAAVAFQTTGDGIRAVGGVSGIGCIFQTVTGLPCPFCGGTRAMVYATHFDPRLFEVNWFWPIAIVGLLVLSIGFLLAPRVSRLAVVDRPFGWMQRHAFALLLGCLAVGWIVALANRQTIVG